MIRVLEVKYQLEYRSPFKGWNNDIRNVYPFDVQYFNIKDVDLTGDDTAYVIFKDGSKHTWHFNSTTKRWELDPKRNNVSLWATSPEEWERNLLTKVTKEI